jgi:hypothetical protein
MEKLSFYRDLEEFKQVIDLLLTSHVKTDVFSCGSEEERCKVVDCCCELKDYISDMMKEEQGDLLFTPAQNN